MKVGKKIFALLLSAAIIMNASVIDALAEESMQKPENPEENITGRAAYAAEVSGQPYQSLQDAVDSVADSGTVKLTNHITLQEQVTIPSEKTILLDMNGKTLSVGFSDSSQNLIVNRGTLIIAGKGGFDAAGAARYRGFLENYGTLTVENGVFQMPDEAMTVHLRNHGTALIEGGSFSGGATIVRSYAGSHTTITDGDFTNHIYPAVDVNGETLITGGTFTNTSCSSCDPNNWGYTIRSGCDKDPDARLTITPASEGSVVVTGTQGGLTAISGTMEVNGGTYRTVDCAQQHGHIFYALYVAGEKGTVQAVINGGTFETKGNVAAVLVGNSGDGGVKEQAVLQIRGGRFLAPENVPAYKVDAPLGELNVSGGTFSSVVEERYLAEGCMQNVNGAVGPAEEGFAAAKIGTAYYQTLAQAVDGANAGDTITLLSDIDLGSGSITIEKAVTLDLSGCTIESSNNVYTLYMKAGLTVRDSKGGGVILNTGSGPQNIAVVVSEVGTEAYFESGMASGYYALFVQKGAKAVISGGRYEGTFAGISVLGLNDEANKTSVEVKGGEIQGGSYAVAGKGTADHTEIVITGGTLEAAAGNVIYHPQVGDLTIGGDAQLMGLNGVQYCGAGTLTIGGNASITATMPYTEFPSKSASQTDGSTHDGAALSVVSRGDGYQDGDQRMTVNITGGTLISRGNAAVSVYRLEQVGGQWVTNENTHVKNYLAALTISGGSFSAGSKKGVFEVEKKAADNVAATGGHFTSDPSEYVPEGGAAPLYVVASDKPGYAYMVTPTAPVEVDPIVVEKTESAVSETIGAQDKTKIEAVIGKAQVSGVSDAVTESAQNVIIDQVEQALTPSDKVVVEITVRLTAAESDLNAGEQSYLSYQAAPVAKVTVNGEVAKENMEVPNTYLDSQASIEVRLPVPADMTLQEIMHISDDGTRERYLSGSGFTVEDDGCAVLHVRHFSTFVLSGQLTVAARIGNTDYGTLQEAVNAANAGDTIVLTQSCDEQVIVSGKSVTIDRDGHAYDESRLALGSYCSMRVSGDKIMITYSAPSGGSSAGGSPSYNVSLPGKVTGGDIKVSPRNADKGDTVTVTVTPDKGYELDKLTVTDQKGDKLELSDKGDGRFTFKMPADRVEVKVSFKLIGAKPEVPAFTDVPADAYYADAVKWAVEQGITLGDSADTFAPNASCTRAQMATFLWRASGSPEFEGVNPFADVSAGAYYYDAVLWAAEKNITNGTAAADFSPDGLLTRGQAVTLLWRANGSPVIHRDINFDDVPADAYYAEAVRWAVSEGITAGTGSNEFSPNAPCTRAQIVTFMYRDMR